MRGYLQRLKDPRKSDSAQVIRVAPGQECKHPRLLAGQAAATAAHLPKCKQFTEQHLVVVADAKNVVLILFGQRAAVSQQGAERAQMHQL